MSNDAIVLHNEIRKLATGFENAGKTHAHPTEGNLS